MALKQRSEARKWALHEDFAKISRALHEDCAMSRLRLRRVNSGEWPERLEKIEEVGKGKFR